MYAWWTFSVPDGGNCGDAEVVAPASLGMGIGPLDPEVRARLGTVDLDGEADQLWGGWLAAEEGEPSAFGYAQPSTGGISADAPPPDGTYTLEPLLLHPLPLAE
jgi:hypothetical protein